MQPDRLASAGGKHVQSISPRAVFAQRVVYRDERGVSNGYERSEVMMGGERLMR